MAQRKKTNRRRRKIQAKDVEGLKYFKLLDGLLDCLHDHATERDRSKNRKLFYDQYASLLLLYFFSPALTSLRALQKASELAKVQRVTGSSRASLGSLSEAGRVFDAELLREILRELATQATPILSGKEADALDKLTAVDGSLLPALPKMMWALWRDDDHRAAKMHLHFDVIRGVPIDATLTEGNGSEREQLRITLQAGRLYVMDRGYAGYEFFQQIIDANASFIGRAQNNAAYRVIEQREIPPQAATAGVIEDVVVDKLGAEKHKNYLKQPVRVIKVDTGEFNEEGNPIILVLVTDRLNLPAELVALAYKYRWAVELFFRWFKCILGCRHLLANSENGVAIQMYVALIASLLISLWIGRKPTKRTFEMLCHYFTGWATQEELLAHIAKLKKHDD
jgi:hypothetical protein